MRFRSYKSATRAAQSSQQGGEFTTFRGDTSTLIRNLPDSCVDLTLTSPPYCIGKEYEESTTVEEFIQSHETILPEIVRVTKDGGSICWQVGYHVTGQSVFPLDYAIFSILQRVDKIVLRNRIIWTYGFGLHNSRRFSGRHEVVLWFTKGSKYYFDLDAVRAPQKYPGKRHYKGPRKGQFSGNPKGKNPGDVWEIPNVRACHVEKLEHPCQFPVGLADRIVRALCPIDGIVFDPYMGTASTGVAAVINSRRFLGSELNGRYYEIASERLRAAIKGEVAYRPADRPIYVPNGSEAVARRPEHFEEVFR